MSGKKGREASNIMNEDGAPIDGHDLVDWDTVTRGAVKYQKPRISPENVLGRLANELPDFEFFQDMGDIKAWQVIVQECGIPSDPEQRRHMGQSDYRAAVKQRLGVEPSPADPSDIRASFGWVVAQFAGFHEILSRQRKNGDLNGAVETAKYIGRLFEWWRWRREGHDAEAVFGRSFSGKTTDAAKKGRTKKGKERAQHVIEFTRRLLDGDYGRFPSGKINQRKLARQYLAVVKPRIKEARVRQIIRAAIHSRELV